MRYLDHRIDLDLAVREIDRRAPVWRVAGITVGETTWVDASDAWPQPLKMDRGAVRAPYSLGIRCSKGLQEGSLVLFNGGWADLEYWAGDDSDVIVEAPGWEDWLSIETFGALLDRFFAHFT